MKKLTAGLYDVFIKTDKKIKDDLWAYIEMLSGEKMKHLGSGFYASVFNNKFSNTVLKVGEFDSNSAYLIFLKYARANQDNPYMPKIYWVGFFENDYDDKYFVVKMEKLSKGWLYVKTRKHLPKWWRVAASIRKLIDEGTFTFDGKPAPVLLVDTIKQLHRLTRKDVNWDLHEGNIMIRENGQAVITDPFY